MADAPGGGFDTGNPAGYIVGAIGEGWSPSEALTTFRADGGNFTTQTWYRLYGEVSDSLAARATAAALNPYTLPDQAAYSTWSLGRGGQYVTTVDVLFRDRDTGLIGKKQYMYKSDNPHAPIEAQDAAYGHYGDPDNQDQYGQVMVGAITRNVYQTEAYNP